MKPFLKWPGNKYQIIDRIKQSLPLRDRLIEPFVGSGAVFLNSHYPNYLLADNNVDLINLYNDLKHFGISFIDYCRSFFTEENNTESKFYDMRKLFNTTNDATLKSALFVYLNKHCYNGLCRYNSKGEFNSPFGRYQKPYFPTKEMLNFYSVVQKATLETNDFRVTMLKAKKGDVVYCDPPYVPLSETSNFTSYSSGGFGFKEQIELAEIARELSRKGVIVVISNHDTEFIIKEYSQASIEKFQVQRYISCNGNNRCKVNEVLAIFSPQLGVA